jgi:serine/threonine protein kinase
MSRVSGAQFLGDRYRLGRQIVRGDRSGRSPSLYEASDAGLFLFARTWARAGDSADLRALWNHEVRSLLRLSGYPRASDYFVRLKDLGIEDKRFYVILDAGDRMPLAPMLADRSSRPWLRNFSLPAPRRRVWEGLRRVATAIGILHEEGTLFRALSPASVFSDNRGDSDFRLSGFEWSLRVATLLPIAGRAAAASSCPGVRLRSPELDKAQAQYSFATDWFDFGLLAAEIFSLPVTERGGKALERLRDQILNLNYFSAPEKAVLLGLLEFDAERRLAQSSTVLQGLSEAHASVRNRTIIIGKGLYVGFLLGTGSRLSEAIAEVTRGGRSDIHPNEVEKQIAFIERDLLGNPQILIRQSPFPHYVINGRLLQYRIQPWERGGLKTWDVGFCMLAEPPRDDPAERTALLDGRKIEVRAAPQLARDLQRARSLGASWEAVFPFEAGLDPLDDRQQHVLDFFRITNQLDALLAAAQIWPVTVVTTQVRPERTVVELTPAPDPERTALALNLKLLPSAEQMREFLGRDATSSPLPEEMEFTLAYDGVLGRGEEESNIRWHFAQAIQHPAGVRYRFYHEDPGLPPTLGALMYLMPRGLAGTVAQLKRRQRAIDGMRSHAGLLSAIADPAYERRDTGDAPGSSDAISDLDESKQDALRGIWCTQPLYTLQGPPGTGKTRLLETMVMRLLERDGSVQVLVTAHSHEAVRNVRRKLSGRIAETKPITRPIVIRLDDDDDEDHVRRTAAHLARAVAESSLARMVPHHLAERARAMARDLTPGKPAPRDVRSFEALVRQAANVVFATSNSGELARMLEDNRRFDWSIIEEAGKAHGFDLALALQASYRILLIGDQEQLPPFNFGPLEALFREPPRILNALKAGLPFAPGLVDRAYVGLDEEDQRRFVESCVGWLDMVQFFAEMFRRCERSELNGIQIAKQLEEQHRMHPDIADLISRCFYQGRLKTHPGAIERFIYEAPPFRLRADGWMPEQRIVFLDLPWIQEEKHATGEQGGTPGSPRYTNPAEVDGVGRALSQFLPQSNEPCHLQILSPYRAQVRLIFRAATEEMAGGKLVNLTAREFDIQQSKRLGATVDEFQGSEADVVVASLVRNNDERIGRGLGFLADPRRVNVLLSRARHKLVLVGSWNFLTSRIDCSVDPREEEELAHIARLMRWLSDNITTGRVARIPLRDTYWGGRV